MDSIFNLMSVFDETELSKENHDFLNKVFSTAQEALANPSDFISDLGSLSLFKIEDPLVYSLALQKIESIDSGLRSLVSVHSSLGLYALKRYGKSLLKDSYLEGVESLAFALTEEDHGSDPASTKTEFKSNTSELILNGKKAWVTNASNAKAIVVWGKLNNEIIGALVPTDTKGLSIKPMPKTFSLELSPASSLEFVNCKIPVENLLTVKGIKGPLSCLNNARLGVAWGVMGASWSAFKETVNYVKERKLFGESLSSKQITQYKLSEIYAKIIETQFYLKEITKRKNQTGSAPPYLVSIAKMRSCQKAYEVLGECRDLLGANGVTENYTIARHMRNIESVRTYEGTDSVHRLILGSYITGEKAF